ncbi:MAG TPA: DUF2196 domain-containing protein [Candidatus Saccharimonadales bacterium]|nr:DUF2196 domain-containing protein [Candidatus Saccharimonadales bacterium]
MEEYIVGSRRPKPGDKVFVIQKKDYGTEDYVEGIVKDVLTSKPVHPRGHKVRLTTGVIGRVQKFSDQASVTPIQPKYQNRESNEPTVDLPSVLPDNPDDLV